MFQQVFSHEVTNFAKFFPFRLHLFAPRNPIVGLTMEISKLVICYLNGTEPSEEILTAVFGEPTGTITKLT